MIMMMVMSMMMMVMMMITHIIYIAVHNYLVVEGCDLVVVSLFVHSIVTIIIITIIMISYSNILL